MLHEWWDDDSGSGGVACVPRATFPGGASFAARINDCWPSSCGRQRQAASHGWLTFFRPQKGEDHGKACCNLGSSSTRNSSLDLPAVFDDKTIDRYYSWYLSWHYPRYLSVVQAKKGECPTNNLAFCSKRPLLTKMQVCKGSSFSICFLLLLLLSLLSLSLCRVFDGWA